MELQGHGMELPHCAKVNQHPKCQHYFYDVQTNSEIIRCQSLTQPSNGAVTISSGINGDTLGRGATATYSCNTGYGLVGQRNRTCVVTNGGTTGTWSGSQPTCQG